MTRDRALELANESIVSMTTRHMPCPVGCIADAIEKAVSEEIEEVSPEEKKLLKELLPNEFTKGRAPTAQEFFKATGIQALNHDQYMDLSESYADFIVEFEKKGGDIGLCERWPLGRAGRFVAW